MVLVALAWHPDENFVRVATIFSAVLVAPIFAWTLADSSETKAALNRLQERIGDLPGLVDDPEGEDSPPPAVVTQSVRTPSGEVVDVAAPEDIPLSVLRDLALGEPTLATLSGRSLVRGLRKAGRGNHAWFVEVLDEDGVEHVWRVAHGGRGKQEPTATEVDAGLLLP